jgi:hypothetical protein
MDREEITIAGAGIVYVAESGIGIVYRLVGEVSVAIAALHLECHVDDRIEAP